jgi:hypothetical protein
MFTESRLFLTDFNGNSVYMILLILVKASSSHLKQSCFNYCLFSDPGHTQLITSKVIIILYSMENKSISSCCIILNMVRSIIFGVWLLIVCLAVNGEVLGYVNHDNLWANFKFPLDTNQIQG